MSDEKTTLKKEDPKVLRRIVSLIKARASKEEIAKQIQGKRKILNNINTPCNEKSIKDLDDELLETTLLGWACWFNRPDLVQLFLAMGSKPSPADGRIPICIAARRGNSEIVGLLVNAGADKDQTDSVWKTSALRLSTMHGDISLCKQVITKNNVNPDTGSPIFYVFMHHDNSALDDTTATHEEPSADVINKIKKVFEFIFLFLKYGARLDYLANEWPDCAAFILAEAIPARYQNNQKIVQGFVLGLVLVLFGKDGENLSDPVYGDNIILIFTHLTRNSDFQNTLMHRALLAQLEKNIFQHIEKFSAAQKLKLLTLLLENAYSPEAILRLLNAGTPINVPMRINHIIQINNKPSTNRPITDLYAMKVFSIALAVHRYKTPEVLNIILQTQETSDCREAIVSAITVAVKEGKKEHLQSLCHWAKIHNMALGKELSELVLLALMYHHVVLIETLKEHGAQLDAVFLKVEANNIFYFPGLEVFRAEIPVNALTFALRCNPTAIRELIRLGARPNQPLFLKFKFGKKSNQDNKPLIETLNSKGTIIDDIDNESPCELSPPTHQKTKAPRHKDDRDRVKSLMAASKEFQSTTDYKSLIKANITFRFITELPYFNFLTLLLAKIFGEIFYRENEDDLIHAEELFVSILSEISENEAYNLLEHLLSHIMLIASLTEEEGIYFPLFSDKFRQLMYRSPQFIACVLKNISTANASANVSGNSFNELIEITPQVKIIIKEVLDCCYMSESGGMARTILSRLPNEARHDFLQLPLLGQPGKTYSEWFSDNEKLILFNPDHLWPSEENSSDTKEANTTSDVTAYASASTETNLTHDMFSTCEPGRENTSARAYLISKGHTPEELKRIKEDTEKARRETEKRLTIRDVAKQIIFGNQSSHVQEHSWFEGKLPLQAIASETTRVRGHDHYHLWFPQKAFNEKTYARFKEISPKWDNKHIKPLPNLSFYQVTLITEPRNYNLNLCAELRAPDSKQRIGLFRNVAGGNLLIALEFFPEGIHEHEVRKSMVQKQQHGGGVFYLADLLPNPPRAVAAP